MIDFYKNRWKYFALSGAFIVIGIIFLFINGLNLDVQFRGGTELNYKYTADNDMPTSQVESLVGDTLGRSATVQTTVDIATGQKHIVITLAGNEGLSEADFGALDAALKSTFSEENLVLDATEVVEPLFGKQFLQNGIWALVISAVLIIFYVWFRFRRVSGLSAGTTGVIALIHDIIMVTIAFIIFRIPVGDSYIAVAMTILGYSINDTIVIYDRVRENSKLNPKMPADEVLNLSTNQCLGRSLVTSLLVLMCIVVVYIFALVNNIESIKSFALPMAVGTIFGCYSSLCICGPLWAMWQNSKRKKAA